MSIILPVFDFVQLEDIADDFFNKSNGAVMGKLGEYPFSMNQNDYNEIDNNLMSTFSAYQPIKGLALTGDSGGTGRNIRLNGVLVAEPIAAIKTLEYLLKRRETIRFTTIDDDFQVVITGLSVVHKNFFIDGKSRVQIYNLTLKEVYGEII